MADPAVVASTESAPSADLQTEVGALPAPGAAPGKRLTAAALRALEEAAARRLQASQTAGDGEAGGPKGLEPTRFGDWERKGLAVDF